MSRNPLWSGHSFRHSKETISAEMQKVAIPSGRGIRSGYVWARTEEGQEVVAIPSGRGIRSGSSAVSESRRINRRRNPLWSGHSFRPGLSRRGGVMTQAQPSQSPLVGAFVPAEKTCPQCGRDFCVAIPSGRGIRSGCKKQHAAAIAGEGRNPLWSGHSFRRMGGYRSRAVQQQVAIPSGRGIRSGEKLVFNIADPNTRSHSPLVGAFVPAQRTACD